MLVVDQGQCFLLMLLVGAVVGFWRGWVREVITCTIILATLLFLTLGGADLLANLLGGRGLGLVPTASAHPLYPAGGGNPSGGGLPGQPPAPGTSGSVSASTACPTNVNAQALGTLIFAGMTWFAYRMGTRFGSPPSSRGQRWAGVIPGAVNGGAIAYWVSRTLLPGQQIIVQSPSSGVTVALLPLVFGFGLLALLAILFIASQTGKGAKPGGGSGAGK